MAGTPVSWVVFFASLLAVGFGVVMYLSDESWGAFVAAGAGLLALAVLVAQIRFSPRQVGRVLGPVFVVGGFITGIVGLTDRGFVLGAGAGAFLFGTAIFVLGTRGGVNPVPGIFDVASLKLFYEDDGVHFAVGWDETPVPRGGSFIVRLLAQNVMTVPRRLRVRLSGAGGLSPFESSLQVLPLEPGVIVDAKVPFRVTALAEGTLHFVVDVGGSGDDAGLRVRHERGAEYVTDNTATNVLGVVSLVAVGIGTFRFGGVPAVKLRVDEQAPLVTEPVELRVERLHVPTAEQIDRASRL